MRKDRNQLNDQLSPKKIFSNEFLFLCSVLFSLVFIFGDLVAVARFLELDF